MYSSTYIWAKVLGHMEQQLTPAVVSTWFDDTEVLELTDQKLVLFSPSTFRKDMIVSRCAVYIQEALKDLFDMELELIVLDETQIDAYRSRKKKPRFIEFNPQFTFDNFIVGNSNRFANAAAVAVAEKPADSYNPLFLYGPSGVGKTHLLYAIANEIHKAHPDYNIVYIKGDQFTNELINALREGKNNEFRLKYRGADLFLVDSRRLELVGACYDPKNVFGTVGLRAPVDYTVVNGKVTVRNGKLVNLDEEKAAREAAALVRDYLSR